MSLPLDGIRVLELGVIHQGPGAAAMLADWGADVVKLEGPDSPDGTRWSAKRRPGHGPNPSFETLNRNKRGIVIDLKQPQGREVLYRLIGDADIFLQNLAPGTAKRLGADYATLSAINPRLVYGSGTAFGHQGPERDRRGMDLSAQARGGMMYSNGDPNPPPVRVRGPLADHAGALLLAFGLVLALRQRDQSGQGQEVNVSLLEGMVWFQSWRLTDYLFSGKLQPTHGLRRHTSPLWNQFEGSDGRWLMVTESQMTRWWPAFCRAIGEPELERHPAMATVPPDQEHLGGLIEYLDALFHREPADLWIERLRAQGICSDPVQDYAEVAEDPQVLANEMIVEYDHPTAGRLRQPGFGVHLSASHPAINRPAPEFGQHTEEVLLEHGFGWDEIAALRENGAVGPRPAGVNAAQPT